MSLRDLPAVKAFVKPEGYDWDAPAQAVDKWTGPVRAAEADTGATISIYDQIGQDYWTGEGFTAKRMAGALRGIGEKPVEVLINSPGGDMFEGLAIYNLLREHPAEVTVKVMGLAASAASVIAMAGDKVLMGLGAFLMIHNSWGIVMGNQNDMRDAARVFAEFDAAMGDIYQARTGLPIADIQAMMDNETWLRASEAVSKGFATGTTDETAPTGAKASADLEAKRRLDRILAQSNMPRSARRKLLHEATGTRDAAEEGTPRADLNDWAALAALTATLRAV